MDSRIPQNTPESLVNLLTKYLQVKDLQDQRTADRPRPHESIVKFGLYMMLQQFVSNDDLDILVSLGLICRDIDHEALSSIVPPDDKSF